MDMTFYLWLHMLLIPFLNFKRPFVVICNRNDAAQILMEYLYSSCIYYDKLKLMIVEIQNNRKIYSCF